MPRQRNAAVLLDVLLASISSGRPTCLLPGPCPRKPRRCARWWRACAPTLTRRCATASCTRTRCSRRTRRCAAVVAAAVERHQQQMARRKVGGQPAGRVGGRRRRICLLACLLRCCTLEGWDAPMPRWPAPACHYSLPAEDGQAAGGGSGGGGKAPSELYGAEHLVRLFVKLPELVPVAFMTPPVRGPPAGVPVCQWQHGCLQALRGIARAGVPIASRQLACTLHQLCTSPLPTGRGAAGAAAARLDAANDRGEAACALLQHARWVGGWRGCRRAELYFAAASHSSRPCSTQATQTLPPIHVQRSTRPTQRTIPCCRSTFSRCWAARPRQQAQQRRRPAAPLHQRHGEARARQLPAHEASPRHWNPWSRTRRPCNAVWRERACKAAGRQARQQGGGGGGSRPHDNWASSSIAVAAVSARFLMLRACAAGRARSWGVGQRAARTCRASIAVRCVHTPGTPESHPRRARAMEVSQQPAELVPQAERAWAWFEEMGAPKYWVRWTR